MVAQTRGDFGHIEQRGQRMKPREREQRVQGRLPYALRRFSGAHPRINLEIVVASRDVLSERFVGGGLDVLIADRAAGQAEAQV
ncbi:hypothetical protein [Paraburkholderia dinghuensis]|uniref:LysR substrate-binding domain-containing protein n=1 Tax=Paraburkholderia dinghuensis TaxID=2305225 RepID=A0A3N6N8L0_9BURK|nr:hypothetical protein [Paraburkholderia dinghuensis]RQH05332.1 hypothetical protein D1Y85_14810 [Paraburkholderia dinghuensis]